MSAKTRVNRPTTATPRRVPQVRYTFISRGLSEDKQGRVIVSPNKGTTYRRNQRTEW